MNRIIFAFCMLFGLSFPAYAGKIACVWDVPRAGLFTVAFKTTNEGSIYLFSIRSFDDAGSHEVVPTTKLIQVEDDDTLVLSMPSVDGQVVSINFLLYKRSMNKTGIIVDFRDNTFILAKTECHFYNDKGKPVRLQ